MSLYHPSLVDDFIEKVNQVGSTEAITWLRVSVADERILAQAQFYVDNAANDQPMAEQMFRAAIGALLGSATPAADDSAEPGIDTVVALLEQLQSQAAFPDSLSRATLKEYLCDLQERERYLKEHNLGSGDSCSTSLPPRLENVYVQRRGRRVLGTEFSRGEAAGEQTGALLELLGQQHRQVITAGPGIGKTFLLRYLCHRHLSPEEGSPFHPGVPVLIYLRRFAPWFREHRPTEITDSSLHQCFWEFLEEQWEPKYSGLVQGFKEWLAAPIVHGQVNGVFLFDGLDEVPIAGSDRQHISRMISVLADRYPRLPIYVTSRVRSYPSGECPWAVRDADGEQTRWPTHEILPFDPAEIDEFIDSWFTELVSRRWLTPTEGEELVAVFRKALSEGQISALADLAPTPLMLTMMCRIHATERRLPRGRADLFSQLLDLLLGKWEERRTRGAEGGIDRFEQLCRERGYITGRGVLDLDTIRRELGSLVFRLTRGFAGAGSSETGIAIAEEELRAFLAVLCRPTEIYAEQPDIDSAVKIWIENMIVFIKEQGGLLDQMEGEGSPFVFPHRQYSEFLAGWYLVQHQCAQPGFSITGVCMDYQQWTEIWREAVLFGVSWLWCEDDRAKLILLVRKLADEDTTLSLQIAGEMLAEFGDRDLDPDLWDRCKDRLEELMLAQQPTVPERIYCGISLGLMGDDRPGVGVTIDGLPDIQWSEVIPPPVGGFRMGADESDALAYVGEKPAFVCDTIQTAYHLSVHPITVAQYECFVEAGGYYEKSKWWSDEGLAWRDEEAISGPSYHSYDRFFQVGNVPATGISYHEAYAYCAWLSENLGHSIRLPLEEEWEYAARGETSTLYPWGDEDDLNARSHTIDQGIYHLSAVGLFGDLGRQYGHNIEDLSGNVWEWTASAQGQYPVLREGSGSENRTLRGGGFYYITGLARASARTWEPPDVRNISIGFRVLSFLFAKIPESSEL